MKIIIAGSNGFIGSHLASYFEKKGHQLILLSRNPKGLNSRYWNPEKGEVDSTLFEGADVVINLCGESIFGRWSESKKEKIRDSRLIPTQFLCDTLLNLQNPPKLYLGASAVGYYGDQPDQVLEEFSPPGKDFLAEVCAAWEQFPKILAQKNIRVVLTRFGIVLGKEGGALKYIDKAFSMGMGGILGSGKQIMSWIAIDDVAAAMEHLIHHPEISGPVNFTAPHPVSNYTFTQDIGKVLNRPTLVPVPKFALSMFFGEGATVFLSSVNALPQVLLKSNYVFQYPHLEEALKKYLLNNG